jgi:hypothetical protein
VEIRIGKDRIGVAQTRERAGYCPADGERGEFRGPALLCPKCGKLLGGA